jgi:hypothetical protein
MKRTKTKVTRKKPVSKAPTAKAQAVKPKKPARKKASELKANQDRRYQNALDLLRRAAMNKAKATDTPRAAHIRLETHRNLFAVEILDADSRRMARGYGELRLDVPAGQYIARCEVGGPTVDKLIEAKAGEETVVTFSREEIYKMPSAAPVSGSVSRHEFFTYPAGDLATAKPAAAIGTGSRLALFASRFEMALQPVFPAMRPVSLEDVRLLDDTGRELLRFPDASSRTQEDVNCGRVGAAIDLNPGGYYLQWPAPDGRTDLRMQPVWLAAGWTTFVFASALGDSAIPRSETASIHMARVNDEVKPWDEETTAINATAELALASLRIGRRQFGDDALNRFMAAKFQNPMLGILGCYVLLAEEERNAALLGALSNHLHQLVGDHPDVRAIDLLRQMPGKTAPVASVFEFPPMLAQGLLGLDRLEWNQGGRLETAREGLLKGPARLARLRALAESPWTTFWHGATTSPDIGPGGDISTITEYLKPLIDLETSRWLAQNRPEFSLPMRPRTSYGAASPFGLAEIEATQEANASLAQYLAQLRPSSGAAGARPLKSQHLNWVGLSPTAARLTASVVAADPAQDSDRLQPL